MDDKELPKRKWVYLMQPMDYEMSPCPCGNTDIDWSEYEKHLWCPKCEKDFIPEFSGPFDGPIGVNLCKMIGITFDRFNLESQTVEEFTEVKRGEWDWVPSPTPSSDAENPC